MKVENGFYISFGFWGSRGLYLTWFELRNIANHDQGPLCLVRFEPKEKTSRHCKAATIKERHGHDSLALHATGRILPMAAGLKVCALTSPDPGFEIGSRGLLIHDA